MPRVNVSIDRQRCVGSGQCVLSAPDVFDQGDEDGLVVLRMAEPPATMSEAIREAERLCPAKAISIGEEKA